MVLKGCPVNEVAQSLGIGENLIYRWNSRSKKQQSTALTGNIVVVTLQVEDEQALHKRIRELETEWDI